MIYDLIIIGGGPAGITAGIYAARKKLNTLLVAKEFGGQMIKAHEVENWPGEFKIKGVDLVKKFVEHLKKFEIEIKEGKNVREIHPFDKLRASKGFKVVLEDGEKLETKTIIIASGKNPRPLKVPGEEKFLGKGVTYCSTCDSPVFKGKDVAVIGGGNAGLDSALDLTKYANKIYVLERGEKITGDESTQEKLEKTGKIEFITNAVTKEIKGDKFVESLVYSDNKELKVQGVFVEIGYVPSSGFIKDLVEFNKRGEIIINPKDNSTKTLGVFAAGDVTDVLYKQIVIAASEGSKASLSAYNYLQKL